nr:glycosyltransferase family 4 protein [Clostridium scatologenes]
MSIIKVLQIISGNDSGGGGNHVLNLSFYSKDKFKCIIGTIGDGYVYENAKKLGIDVVNFTSKSAYDGTIIKYVKENNIDIINFHGAKAFFMHYFLKSKLLIPCTATVHSDYKKDFINSKIKHIFFTPLSIMGLKSFNYYICVSKYISNLLEKDNFTGKKFVVNNGIDFENIKVTENRSIIREKYNIGEKSFVYVNVARMHPIKNHLNLIEAFNKLKTEINDVKLILVGDGVLQDIIKEKVKTLKLDNYVKFTGFSSNAINFVNASDISILTSFSEGGSPPLVVLESGAVKKAFICSDIGDIKETINEERGFLVDPNSVEDIYRKMKEAYENKEKLNAMGECLYNFIKDKYSINRFCDKYYKAYEEMLRINSWSENNGK